MPLSMGIDSLAPNIIHSSSFRGQMPNVCVCVFLKLQVKWSVEIERHRRGGNSPVLCRPSHRRRHSHRPHPHGICSPSRTPSPGLGHHAGARGYPYLRGAKDCWRYVFVKIKFECPPKKMNHHKHIRFILSAHATFPGALAPDPRKLLSWWHLRCLSNGTTIDILRENIVYAIWNTQATADEFFPPIE